MVVSVPDHRMWKEFCCFCRREATVGDWADRRGWLEVECPHCGAFRAERQFWVAAHLKRARQPVLFRALAHWLADHRERTVAPEIPFEGWETVAAALDGR
jgi:hypothetical protein